MCVILNIFKINDILYDYFKTNIYDIFLNNYCLEYYYLLKSLYPECKMVLEKKKEHCAALINGNVYDVTGLREISNFVIAKEEDLYFVDSFYNKFDLEKRKELINLINGNRKTLIK